MAATTATGRRAIDSSSRSTPGKPSARRIMPRRAAACWRSTIISSEAARAPSSISAPAPACLPSPRPRRSSDGVAGERQRSPRGGDRCRQRAGRTVRGAAAARATGPRASFIPCCGALGPIWCSPICSNARCTISRRRSRAMSGPGGTAILSGLTLTQARAIEARTRSHGFALKKQIILDGWATLVITRRSARIVRD